MKDSDVATWGEERRARNRRSEKSWVRERASEKKGPGVPKVQDATHEQVAPQEAEFRCNLKANRCQRTSGTAGRRSSERESKRKLTRGVPHGCTKGLTKERGDVLLVRAAHRAALLPGAPGPLHREHGEADSRRVDVDPLLSEIAGEAHDAAQHHDCTGETVRRKRDRGGQR